MLGLYFFRVCIFEKSGKNEATDLAVSQLLGSTIAIISAHVPGLQMWASASQGPSSSSPKQWKCDGHVQIYNSVSARSLRKSKKTKKYRERSVSALTDLVPHKMAEALQTSSGIEPKSPDSLLLTLTTKPVLGMSLRKVTLLGSNLASVTDFKRIETPHS